MIEIINIHYLKNITERKMPYGRRGVCSNLNSTVYPADRQTIKMDGIIFDLDGTLWNSTETVAESWNKAIAEHSDLDVRIDGEILSGLFGKTMEVIYDTIFPGLSLKERLRLGQFCFDYENKLLETKPGVLYDGVADTLKALAKKTRLFIVSNCQCGYIEVFLKTSGLSNLITDHLCYGETLTSKGQTILKLMERNALKDVVYVGDTQGDCDACREADIPFIFATYGFGSVPDAAVRIENFPELMDCCLLRQR